MGKVDVDCRNNSIVSQCKSKCHAYARNNYQSLTLTNHVLRVIEILLQNSLLDKIKIENFWFSFIARLGTTDATVILRLIKESYRKKPKELYMAFEDTANVVDRVLQNFQWRVPQSALCAENIFCYSTLLLSRMKFSDN